MMYKSVFAGLRPALLGCTALIGASLATQAFAQAAEDEGAMLGEIVVTAQKREQSLQDVPIAVTAVTQESIQANRITSVMDLAGMAPNLAMRVTAGGSGIPNFSMRGSVSYGSVAGQDKAISMYIDGVYIGSSQGSAFELPDLERIEVLRGPQGTLFGRNSTAGAISIITREPSGEFSGRQVFTYGNYDQFRSSTRIELPAWGPVAASISYTHDERTGDMKNLAAGRTWNRTGPNTDQGVQVSPKTLGDKSTDSVFAAVKFEPTDNFKMVYRYDWMESHFTPEGTGLVAFTPGALGAFGAPLAAAFAANPGPIVDEHRPKYVSNPFHTEGYQRVSGHNLTANLRINDSLSLKNIFAHRKSYIFANSDIAGAGDLIVTPAVAAALEANARLPAGSLASVIGSPYVAAGSQAASHADQWSEEIQLNYDSKLVTVTAGAIYFDINTHTGAADGLGTTRTLTPIPGGNLFINQKNYSLNSGKSLAGYVQAEVHVNEQIDVVGGYRLTQDKKSGTTFVSSVPFSFTYKKTKPSYLAGVNYKPNSDLLLYAKYSTGFVSGGAVSGIPFEPETVKAWEGGIKADLLNRRLRTNLAVFQAKYKNLQAVSSGSTLPVPRPELGTLVLREADLDTKGIEGEIVAAPMRGLTLNGGFGYTDSDMSNFNLLLRPVGAQNATVRPEWTANAAATYETEPVWNEARLSFRVDATWRSKFRMLGEDDATLPEVYDPIIFSKAMWLVNARVALKDIQVAGATAEVALWGKNLTDSDNPAQAIYFRYLGSTSYQRARTFGVDVSLDF